MRQKKLTRSFFDRHSLEVAKDLIGKIIYYKNKTGMIIETEAYRGLDDPASHAAKGLTPRTELMFGKPGLVYIYLVYGMHYCLNFVTESDGQPGAVLIRGVKLLDEHHTTILGPGRVTKYFDLNLTENGSDIITSNDFYVMFNKKLTQEVTGIKSSSRIGIKKGLDKHWRFFLED